MNPIVTVTKPRSLAASKNGEGYNMLMSLVKSQHLRLDFAMAIND